MNDASASTGPSSDARPGRIAAACTANVIVLGVLGLVAWLYETDGDLYYRALQEDEALEWATFWAFFVAAAGFAWAAVRQRRAGVRVPWFLAGLSLFCFVVGMEEISWAQRLFSYRPPEYFLANNFQQEFNFHNVVDSDLRKLAMKLIIGVYGGLLPILAAVPALRTLIDRLAIVGPPLAFLPAFAATYWIYEDYPWKFSGETVELMLGLGFLFSSLWALRRFSKAPPPGPGREVLCYAAAFAGVAALGAANAQVARIKKADDPLYVIQAQGEVDALRADFEAIAGSPDGRLATGKNIHKRVYSYMEKYGKFELLEGAFGSLQAQGLAEERAGFFLDPWNAPYWIRDRGGDGTTPRVTFVYSFGPNMKRDSSPSELLGDGVGAYIHGTGPDR